MNGNDFAGVFATLFSKVGIYCLWATFFFGALVRWVANARVKGQIKFLNAYDRSLLSLKETPSLSQSDLREKSEALFRSYYPTKGGGRLLRSVDRILGGETTSWTLVDRVVHMAFDHRPGSANERARYVLSSTPTLTHFLNFFSLGAFHRIGAATPALLLILGAIGTYTGFLTALPLLNPSDIADVSALGTTIQNTLGRMSAYTGYTILGSLLAFASVLVNAICDAERSFQSATHRLAHIVEFLGGVERSPGMPQTSASPAARPRKGNLKSVPHPEAFVEEKKTAETPVQAETPEPVVEAVDKMPVARRQRAEVVKAEADWGPLPLSAVPSPKKKPIRVEAADAPKPEPVRTDDEIVAEEVTPEISVTRRTIDQAAAPVPTPAPEPVRASPAPAEVTSAAVAGPQLNATEFQFPETALPSDWEQQIRGLKSQLESMQPSPTEIPDVPPEVPTTPPVPQEVPYDEGLEKTHVGVPQLTETHTETASRSMPGPMRPEFTAAPEATDFQDRHDSPTEAELLAMMVPKEWSTQRPADTMPTPALPEDFDMPDVPAPAPTPVPRPMAAVPTPAPVAPAKPSLTAAEQDRLAILEHRMDKVSLYLSKAAQDLKEGIISQEMFDDETSRWRQEVEGLNKELVVLSAKKAA